MKKLAALLAIAFVVPACGKVEPLRPAGTDAPVAGSARGAAVTDVPSPPPEAQPRIRNPFVEPDRPREDDEFDLPPTRS